jgi:hypothetical protein
MLLKKILSGAGLGLGLLLAVGCAHHQQPAPSCNKPAVIGAVPIAPAPCPSCPAGPGVGVPPGAVAPGAVPPPPPPTFIPSAQTGVFVPQPY